MFRITKNAFGGAFGGNLTTFMTIFCLSQPPKLVFEGVIQSFLTKRYMIRHLILKVIRENQWFWWRSLRHLGPNFDSINKKSINRSCTKRRHVKLTQSSNLNTLYFFIGLTKHLKTAELVWSYVNVKSNNVQLKKLTLKWFRPQHLKGEW